MEFAGRRLSPSRVREPGHEFGGCWVPSRDDAMSEKEGESGTDENA